jgi:D-amino-acid dehydrogenase
MLTVYETEQAFAGDAEERRILKELGAELAELGADEIRQMEPSLTHDLSHATYFPACYSTINPYRLTHNLAADFLGHGGRLRQATVTGVGFGAGGRVDKLETDHGDMPVDRLVVAAGAWSARVAALMGLSVLLDTERGYHTVCHGIDTGLTRPLIHAERHFGLNQMDEGIRFAGTVELAGVDAPPNDARADNVFNMGKGIFRDFDPSRASHTTKWMGCRPTMPDYLPVLGPAPGLANVWFDFGHQHLGLSLAARSGEIIAALVAGRDPGLDLAPFRANRF